jgi:hypothetical protein
MVHPQVKQELRIQAVAVAVDRHVMHTKQWLLELMDTHSEQQAVQAVLVL